MKLTFHNSASVTIEINAKTYVNAETITFPSRGPKVHKTRLDILAGSQCYDSEIWKMDVWSSKNLCTCNVNGIFQSTNYIIL